uniref:SLC26A/SulP transporter domain-containing protein n=1 Tax=Timema bartmani TaxID=61472 RepID=A0A7R9I8K6_9NEOP|nr:unnamed protein product [Timema bartmani]
MALGHLGHTLGSITIVPLDKRIDGGLHNLPEVVFDTSACLVLLVTYQDMSTVILRHRFGSTCILLTWCYIPPGLPAFQLPPFGFTRDSNTTVTFYEMTTSLGWGILILPLVGLLENIAICKAFSNGKPVDASQELLALGISNIGNSLVQGFPGSGSLSRSAVNNSSGVRTPMGGLYTGDTLAQPVVRGQKQGPITCSTGSDTFSNFSSAAREFSTQCR